MDDRQFGEGLEKQKKTQPEEKKGRVMPTTGIRPMFMPMLTTTWKANMAKTPTLFIQSDEDYRCWMGDAIQMFSALKYFGVDARLCLFHGENHELSRSGKPTHRIRRMQEMMDWFDKYLN